MNKLLENLTAAQREAVTHIDGPMLVVAGAGSGKTRVVTRRIAWLIHQGVRPQQILAMTFTNKAASEMKERVAELTGETPRWVGTFHSACARFLRFDLDKLGEGRDSRFTILDSGDQTSLVKKCLAENGDADTSKSDSRLKPKSIISRISRAKSDLVAPEDFSSGASWVDEVIAKTYTSYERKLRAMNAVDFDDLLLLTVRMLEKVPGLREKYLQRYRYLLIDEYQDTNRTQYRLMKLLTGATGNVHATGDPDQSIYSWRGADYRNIMDFTKDNPTARVVRLEQNYRSTKSILSIANQLIRNNTERIDKDLFTENESGAKPVVACLPDSDSEANWVCERVQDLVESGTPLNELAIFYRTNAQSRAFEEVLIRDTIPYQIIGGVRFYERREIKDFLAYLKILVNDRDNLSLERILGSRPTGVGGKTLQAIQAEAERVGVSAFSYLQREDFAQIFPGRRSQKLKDFAAWCRTLGSLPLSPVDDCVEAVLKHSRLIKHLSAKAELDPANEERLENLNTFVGRAVEFAATSPTADLAAFLEDVALVADVDSWEAEADKLSLMTLHSAKGLEFAGTFIGGLENGILPHANARTEFALEEERRLLYVGITRAKKSVFLSHAMTRFLWGQTNAAVPSSFLDELPPRELEHVDLARANYNSYDDNDDDDISLDDEDGIEFGGEWDFTSDENVQPAKQRARQSFASGKREREDSSGVLFRVGDHVNHATFGRGKILSVNRKQVVVQFFAIGTKLLHLDAAKLVKC